MKNQELDYNTMNEMQLQIQANQIFEGMGVLPANEDSIQHQLKQKLEAIKEIQKQRGNPLKFIDGKIQLTNEPSTEMDRIYVPTDPNKIDQIRREYNLPPYDNVSDAGIDRIREALNVVTQQESDEMENQELTPEEQKQALKDMLDNFHY